MKQQCLVYAQKGLGGLLGELRGDGGGGGGGLNLQYFFFKEGWKF